MGMKRICFIHVPKTGGTYTQEMFRRPHRNPGPFRLLSRGNHPHVGFTVFPPGLQPAEPYKKLENKHLYPTEPPKEPGAEDVVFSNCRNPFSMLVSMFTHSSNPITRGGGLWGLGEGRTFEEFINEYCADRWPENGFNRFLFFQWFGAGGRLLPHHIVRMEHLTEGTEWIRKTYDLPPPYRATIGRRINVNPKHGDYREAYTTKLIDMVQAKTVLERTLLGYDFEGPTDDRKILDLRGTTYDLVSRKLTIVDPGKERATRGAWPVKGGEK